MLEEKTKKFKELIQFVKSYKIVNVNGDDEEIDKLTYDEHSKGFLFIVHGKSLKDYIFIDKDVYNAHKGSWDNVHIEDEYSSTNMFWVHRIRETEIGEKTLLEI